MSDLISRDAVLDYPIRLDHYDEEHGNRHFVLGIESVMEYVEYLPSAEPNIVRCRDCKHYNPYEDQREYDCPTGMCGVMKDDYCSFAERKEE